MHIKPDPHAIVTDGLPKYNIQSVYLDTEDLKLYYEKLGVDPTELLNT